MPRYKVTMPHHADDEFVTGPFANLFFYLGCMDERARVTSPTQIYPVALLVESCASEMERLGMRVSANHAKTLYSILDGLASGQPSSGPSIHDQVTLLRQALHIELESTFFLRVDPSVAHYYREPRRDWEEVIERFPDAISDIEECSKCYAVGRYAASVFHSMQVLEHGLLALGEFMEIPGPKSGFTAVANALQRIKGTKYENLTDFEKKHFAFFEQMHGSVHAVKDAWRNKVSHAQGKLTVMTADFSPQVAIEIYMATRALMRRLATELPKRGWRRR